MIRHEVRRIVVVSLCVYVCAAVEALPRTQHHIGNSSSDEIRDVTKINSRIMQCNNLTQNNPGVDMSSVSSSAMELNSKVNTGFELELWH